MEEQYYGPEREKGLPALIFHKYKIRLDLYGLVLSLRVVERIDPYGREAGGL